MIRHAVCIGNLLGLRSWNKYSTLFGRMHSSVYCVIAACLYVNIDYVQFVLLKSLWLLKRDSTTKPNLYKPTFLVVAQRTPSLLGPGPSFAALEFIVEAEHKDALMETFQPEDMAKVEQALRKAMGHAS